MGVCSALFELGGMTVMHDASGCNSTYTTHDEPRWYDMDSMVYISGLSEIEAIMGDDEKLIGDICEAAADLHPEFIAIAGSPISAMTGFDYEAVAEVIELRTGIPSFGFPTTGMNTYVHGASMALAGIAKRFIEEPSGRASADSGAGESGRTAKGSGDPCKVNILGLTPLDFSIIGMDRSIEAWLEENGFEVISKWAMGSSLDEIRRAGEADVNLVVSAAGIGAADVMRDRFGIPYVTGLPVGTKQKEILAEMLRECAAGNEADCRTVSEAETDQRISAVIGEGITSLALARAIEYDTGMKTKVLCTTECPDGILRKQDRMTPDEDDIIPELADAAVIIADPLYKPICPAGAKFVDLPSEAFSGRIFRKDIPDLACHESYGSFIRKITG